MMGMIGILMGKYVFTLARLLGMSVNLQFLGCLKPQTPPFNLELNVLLHVAAWEVQIWEPVEAPASAKLAA